jgi:pimeloyl-ACP methyl ester carboxylesterase
MKRKLLLVAALVPLVASMIPVAAHAAHTEGADRSKTVCSAPRVSAPEGARIESATAVAHAGGTETFPGVPGLPAPEPLTDVPAWCEVTVTVAHADAVDHVNIKVALPQDQGAWNGRLQALGGSAYLAGDLGAPAVAAVKAGYVGAVTDAGIGQSIEPSAWALTPEGAVNAPLLTNFASRSVHDLATVSKEVVKEFYGKSARYSYWNGCSTGGRQGYMAAQQYPEDFDGILAAAPAVNWDRFAVATAWSQAVFNEENVAPSLCELEAFNSAAVAACDTIDGVKDGIIDNPQECDWDPRALVGSTVICEGEAITITQPVADAVRRIWDGPVSTSGEELWYGPNKGASFAFLGQAGAPFFVADKWVKYFVEKNPSFDLTQLTYEKFDEIFAHSQEEFHATIGTDDADLSAFAQAGGKLLSWHGQQDQLIPTEGTVDYRERVSDAVGGEKRADEFYRLFLLPGVLHCGGGPGQQPVDPLGALVKWVEKGKAPHTLATATVDTAGTTLASHDVCRYPMETVYDGIGDPAAASSYHCER